MADKCACGCGHLVREGQRFFSRDCWDSESVPTGSPGYVVTVVTPVAAQEKTVSAPIKTEKTISRGRPSRLSDDERKAKRQAVQRAYREKGQ